jgi:hypothetical protein
MQDEKDGLQEKDKIRVRVLLPVLVPVQVDLSIIDTWYCM